MMKVLHRCCNVVSFLSLTGILAHFVGSLGSNFNEIAIFFLTVKCIYAFWGLDYE